MSTKRRPTIGSRITSLWSFHGSYRVLHLTWFAFFVTFVVWFNFAPFAKTIGEQLHLSKAQLVTLGLCNVALTVPARVFVGMALDRFGPRRTFSGVLVFAVVPCTVFALGHSFTVLVVSRLLLGIVGAGFVVGIRMVSEWFPAGELGTAEGVYGGWGNFGASAAAFGLPGLAAWLGGPDGWRWAVALTGVISAVYGLAYLHLVEDTPAGVTYLRSHKRSGLEVTSPAAVWGLAALTVPVWGVLALVAWRIWDVRVISTVGLQIALSAIVVALVWQMTTLVRINDRARADGYPQEERYAFRSVAVLCFSYFCTFGSELAVVSMLPTFFADTWSLGAGAAGLAASAFAFMNLVTRPGGGLLSDVLTSRRKALTILLGGLAVGFIAMSALDRGWPLGGAILVSMGCSIFGQAGNGAVYAIAPLLKKHVSGQIAGLIGAYGNIGAIVFLTLLMFVTPRTFFLVIAAVSAISAILSRLLVEPAAPDLAVAAGREAAPIVMAEPALVAGAG